MENRENTMGYIMFTDYFYNCNGGDTLEVE